MAGYLYRVATDFVSDEELSTNKLKQIRRELNDHLHVLVLDEEVTVVKDDEQELRPQAVHVHRSSDYEACDFCVQVLAQDLNMVLTPEEEKENQ